jgi:hypothetical protein
MDALDVASHPATPVPAEFIAQYGLPTATDEDHTLNQEIFTLSEQLKSAYLTDEEKQSCIFTTPAPDAINPKLDILKFVRSKDLTRFTHPGYTVVFLDALDNFFSSTITIQSSKPARSPIFEPRHKKLIEIIVESIVRPLEKLSKNGISAAIRTLNIAKNIEDSWGSEDITQRSLKRLQKNIVNTYCPDKEYFDPGYVDDRYCPKAYWTEGSLAYLAGKLIHLQTESGTQGDEAEKHGVEESKGDE